MSHPRSQGHTWEGWREESLHPDPLLLPPSLLCLHLFLFICFASFLSPFFPFSPSLPLFPFLVSHSHEVHSLTGPLPLG